MYNNTYTHGIGQDSAPIQYCYIADACVLGKQLWLSILCHQLFIGRASYRMYARNLPSSLPSIISTP